MRRLINFYIRRRAWLRWIAIDNAVCDEFMEAGGPLPIRCIDVHPHDRVYTIMCHDESYWYFYPDGRIEPVGGSGIR